MTLCNWVQPMTCLRCGGELAKVNGTASPTLAVTIVRCDPCDVEYEATTRLLECRRTTRVQRGRRVA